MHAAFMSVTSFNLELMRMTRSVMTKARTHKDIQLLCSLITFMSPCDDFC